MRRTRSEEPESQLDLRIRRLQRRRSWNRLLVRLLVTGLITYLAFGVVFGLAVVKGDSMVPALRQGDVILIFRPGGVYRAGDIVLVDLEDGGDDSIKRIVALPGQAVEIDEGHGMLVIDALPLLEPYIYDETHGKSAVSYPLTLREDEFFLLGDHRGNSLDSRNYGPVTADKLMGRMIAVFRMSEGMKRYESSGEQK